MNQRGRILVMRTARMFVAAAFFQDFYDVGSCNLVQNDKVLIVDVGASFVSEIPVYQVFNDLFPYFQKPRSVAPLWILDYTKILVKSISRQNTDG